ncbi:G-protein coupled receptor family C group 5 member C [Python bivittatus]|uniref:G-protein coupled receptor family C group 5 member C n=1 Tax=Python bivittatus TaxID=176946 RepID=A0A9F5IX73_PYTBI|nr:G-protein coupled receptor family C group 5 member C [Python bivittatus]XP_025020595.1 G-protein coupled receptor family C group 5 member C [Python bivittatus]XP_025020626.1 G-protein coupled receptor family C group 5 member C [Python bivittatus]XP_025020661.1 G-protein coupled receptor family C group 5 member C [Python bivittatus]
MMAAPRTLLPCLWLLVLPMKTCLAQVTSPPPPSPPPGCGKDLNSIYYNLCDLSIAWGIVLEAVASFGVVTSFVLTVVLVASVPFIQDYRKKSLVGTQAFFLLGTFGLFCLTFAFIVKQDFSTCASRRFLFGVLFAICFSCLAAHTLSLNFFARQNTGPRGWVTFGMALVLVLVEIIINAEWLIITVVRTDGTSKDPCELKNEDFVMALIYVMFLQVATFIATWPVLCGHYKHWRKHAVFILLTTSFSMAIWIVWIVMYVYGNQQEQRSTWDDPTLAIALVSNASVFVLFYVIPEISQVIKPGPEQAYEDDVYPTRGVGYETILKEQKSQSMFVENKAFSMDEPSSAKKPVSPYSGYNGQLLTSVYQPTEMTLMHKGPLDAPYDVILPRATANSQVMGSANSTLRADDAYISQSKQALAQKDGRNGQASSPYSKNRW